MMLICKGTVHNSPKKSIICCSLDYGILKTIIQTVLLKWLRLHASKFNWDIDIKETNHEKRIKYANWTLSATDKNEDFSHTSTSMITLITNIKSTKQTSHMIFLSMWYSQMWTCGVDFYDCVEGPFIFAKHH